MMCRCCQRVIRWEFEKAGIGVEEIGMGRAVITFDPDRINMEMVKKILQDMDMDLVEDREDRLVEEIKRGVIDLIHRMNNVDSVVRKSEYLVEKTGLSYPYLSRIFSQHEQITLERYIILHKIERIKELIDQEELTLSEIAFMMDYSSVQYLSQQFKQITGMTVSEYKDSDRSSKLSLDRIH